MSLDDRNAELDHKLEQNPIDEQIAALFKADRRRKSQIVLLTVSIMLDVFLTFAFGYVSIRTAQLARQAESNEAAIVARCETTNESRARNEKLWDYLVDQSKNQQRTPEQQKFFDNFTILKDQTFAPSDCSKLH